MQNDITKRSVIIGCILIPIVCFWIAQSEIRTGWATEITCTTLLIGAVFILFILILTSLALERFLPKLALSGTEITIVYVMLTIAMSIAGIGMMGFLTPALVNIFWFDTVENEWSYFHEFIPDWFAPRGDRVIRDFFLGDASLFTQRNFQAWLVPIAVWCSFIFALLFVMFCLSVIMRKQWVEHEHLDFPITTLPIEMVVRERTSVFLKSRVFWAGFIIVSILESMNTLHSIYPAFPYIHVRARNIGHYFTDRPWNAMGQLLLQPSPLVIGMSFFLSLEVSLSLWFFYLFTKVQRVLGSVMGIGPLEPIHWVAKPIPSLTRFPGLAEQGAGAWIGLALASLWIGRGHIRSVLKNALSSRTSIGEAVSYRTAVVGTLGGMIFLVLFSCAAGMPFHVAILFFAILFIYVFAYTKIRAEASPAWLYGPYVNPQEFVTRVLGSRGIGTPGLTVLSYYQWFNLDYRCLPMPHLLEGLRIADVAKIKSQRKIAFAMIIAVVLGILSAFIIDLQLHYSQGADTPRVYSWRIYMTNIPYRSLRHLTDRPFDVDGTGMLVMLGGMLTMLGLTAMRMRFLWWPLRPAGYALANTFTVHQIWFGIFIGWLAKFAILRIGGIKLYRRALPFFIGVVIGECTVAGIWAIIGAAFDIPGYRIFP